MERATSTGLPPLRSTSSRKPTPRPFMMLHSGPAKHAVIAMLPYLPRYAAVLFQPTWLYDSNFEMTLAVVLLQPT